MHLPTLAAGLALAAAGYIATNHFSPSTSDISSPVTQVRVGKSEWPALSAHQIAALKNRFQAIGGQNREVVVLCGGLLCKEFAQDLEEAFVDAGWRVALDQPIVDTLSGVNIAPRGDKIAGQIAAAIQDVAGVPVGEFDGEPGKITIDVGRKTESGKL